ncbi:MAG: ATP-binding domain-containing protein, partial [Muribaculaceae bacterium]|nr:ATP-binding domain-containing protein [Muribaculaceae bacterium]
VKYGMYFANVRLAMLEKSEIEFDAKIILDNLNSEQATVPASLMEQMFVRIVNDPEKYSSSTPMSVRMRDLMQNPYYNALQMKFAYAVTCHKAQGGQWSNVFVDTGYIPEDALGTDLYRWLYTSVSRARKNLYFINPSDWMSDENH